MSKFKVIEGGRKTPSSRTPRSEGMRAADAAVFAQVARAVRVWILLRATNKASLKFIGGDYPNIYPKPLTCKAKTANAGPRAGLVVNPLIDSSSFSPQRLDSVVKTWKDWAPQCQVIQFPGLGGGLKSEFQSSLTSLGEQGQPGMPIGYRYIEDRQSPFYACVQHRQSTGWVYLHGDYDLYDIIDPKDPNCKRRIETDIQGGKSFSGPKTPYVLRLLNQGLQRAHVSAEMIQHGEWAAQFSHKDDIIFCFGPNRQEFVIAPFGGGTRVIESFYHHFFNDRTLPENSGS